MQLKRILRSYPLFFAFYGLLFIPYGLRITVLLSIGILILSGCSQESTDIQVSDIVALPSSVMKGLVSVYMRISNNGARDYLIDARTGIDGTITELHDVRGGKMVKIRDIKIPSKGNVEMIPGGLHIMIFNLPDNVMNGDEITSI